MCDCMHECLGYSGMWRAAHCVGTHHSTCFVSYNNNSNSKRRGEKTKGMKDDIEREKGVWSVGKDEK